MEEEKISDTFKTALKKLEDIEQEWEDRILDYIDEHYPTQATLSAQTTSREGLREREAMKNDGLLKKMRAEADAAFDAADEKVTAIFKEENNEQVEHPLLLFKGGRREIEITSGKAVIRTNGNEYDATGILRSLEKAGVNVRDVTEGQWTSMLKGQGTCLDPRKPKSLFSIQKQASGYGMRIADIAGSISASIQKEV